MISQYDKIRVGFEAIPNFVITVILLVCWFGVCSGQYEDVRCKCVCPSLSVLNDSSHDGSSGGSGVSGVSGVSGATIAANTRNLYIANIAPNQCNCDYVVLPKLQQFQDRAKEFCPRCECKYESRNTSTIRLVVILIIGIIAFLLIYMAFLMLLDPLLHKSSTISRNYQQHIDEEVSMEEQLGGNTENSSRRRATTANNNDFATSSSTHAPQKNMLNKVGLQQNRWKTQVQEQRKNIYDKHTMLN